MIEQLISHLMVKISLLYVIRNRSYSHLKKCSRFWVKAHGAPEEDSLTLQYKPPRKKE